MATLNQKSEVNGHDTSDSKHKDAESQEKPARSRFTSAVQTFSPIWFALVMNTGILGILMHEQPLPYNGYWWQICSYILYVTSVILFFTFSFVFLLRALLYPKTIPTPGSEDVTLSVETSSIAACWPIAALTLVDQTIVIASDANWNGTGHGFMVFCYVAWWCVVFWLLVTAQTTLVNLTRKKDEISVDQIPPAVIIPGVGVVTAALTGAVVVTYGYDVSVQLAVPVIIVGYILLGWGIFWALFVYAAFFVKILDTGFPPAEKVPTLLFLVGPPGQTAGALVILGTAAQKYFPQYATESPIFSNMGGDMFFATSVLLAFIFLGLYALWLIYAIYGVLQRVFEGGIKSFAFSWWGTIFPTATGNLAFQLLSIGINSQAFAILSLIWLTVLFIDYFVCLFFTIKGIASGQILDGRDEDEKKRRRGAKAD